jgi:uncharacterized protein
VVNPTACVQSPVLSLFALTKASLTKQYTKETLVKLTKRINPHFRQTDHGMVLVATRCAGQSEPQFPPPEFVHNDARHVDIDIGPLGQLYTYTVVHLGKNDPAYALAMVDFEPGIRIFGRLLYDSAQTPSIGGTVRVVPFDLPDGSHDYAFKPVQGAVQ